MHRAFLIFILFFSTLVMLNAEYLPAPQISSQAAVLMEAQTGAILFEKNSRLIIPPASLTKLFVIHLVYQQINSGAIGMDDLVPITSAADYRNAPPRSSLMFVREGERVTVLELLQGLALPSGNDAAVALAEFLYGSMELFIERMNSEATRLGLEDTYFVDSSGYSENNSTTAGDFARFCRFYVAQYPDALDQLHSKPLLTYPRRQNYTAASGEGRSITQYNRNVLIDRLVWVDGLKTGYIDESGYNLAASARMGDRRLILVLLGGHAANSAEGNIIRAIDATLLFSYGFYNFTNITPDIEQEMELPIRFGIEQTFSATTDQPLPLLTLNRKTAASLTYNFNVAADICAPLPAGALVAECEVLDQDNNLLATVVYRNKKEQPIGSAWQQWLNFR